MKRPIENNSSPGQAVYDPFLGSGTTMIAAEMTSRACHGIELNPLYIDVIIRRWQNFTGQSATLEGDGRTFDERYIDCAIRRWQNFTGQFATLEGDGRTFDEIAGQRLADQEVA